MLVCKCDMCRKEIPQSEGQYVVSLTEGRLDIVDMSSRKNFDMCKQCATILFEGLLRNKEERYDAEL